MRYVLIPLLLLAGPWTSHVQAQKKDVEIQQRWRGSVADTKLMKLAPQVIASQKKLEGVWKDWKIAGDPPAVDFKKNLVVVATWRGSSFNPIVTLDEKGNLAVGGFGTEDLRPGFRFVLAVISREGVVTVNGKKLPDE